MLGDNTKMEQELHVAEMEILRWSLGHTYLDRVKNENIREHIEVAPIQLKLREARLRWYGHNHEESIAR